jgi:hypothetical protein
MLTPIFQPLYFLVNFICRGGTVNKIKTQQDKVENLSSLEKTGYPDFFHVFFHLNSHEAFN